MLKIYSGTEKDHFLLDALGAPSVLAPAKTQTTSYDHKDSIYVLFQDDETGARIRLRLNPMTSPNQVRDMLQYRVSAYEKPYIWECSALSFGDERIEPTPALYKKLMEALSEVRARHHMGTLLFLTKTSRIAGMKGIGKFPFLTILPVDKKGELSLALLPGAYHH
ncbi:MAG: hypothetical protein C0514_00745 [Candidatus Puniceispirillum sp.]|nr:hypothetical protein [Candidatus Puniceispirillum sp.]